MKEYVVKTTTINLETLNTMITFIGKDGYVHDEIKYADGWKRKHFAEQYIENDINCSWNKKVDDRHCIESGKWLHHYEIIERDAE